MSNQPNWDEFTQRLVAPEGAPTPTFEEICARALTSAAGRELIAALRARYIDLPQSPLQPEPALRVRATQMQFVRDLEAARDAGLARQKTL